LLVAPKAQGVRDTSQAQTAKKLAIVVENLTVPVDSPADQVLGVSLDQLAESLAGLVGDEPAFVDREAVEELETLDVRNVWEVLTGGSLRHAAGGVFTRLSNW
jgi:hypothetical protein